MPKRRLASNMAYAAKARLIEDLSALEQYRRVLEKDDIRNDEPHWNAMSKNTITLFQVLIDQDLTHLVMVLTHYPKYINVVCEHFRYAYSYSENEADIDAASELLKMGEPHFTKQFVRNVVRKLPKVDQLDTEALNEMAQSVRKAYTHWHPIVTNFYITGISERIRQLQLHPLQRIALLKHLEAIECIKTYDYAAEDRDAGLDIPYMN